MHPSDSRDAIKSILTHSAPTPAGHYSQAVVHAGLVYVAGQLPLDPRSGQLVENEIEAQTTRVLENIQAVLRAAGSSLADVLRVTIYVTDIAHWPKVNAVYARYFGDHRPARTVTTAPVLHHGALLEAEAIARLTPKVGE